MKSSTKFLIFLTIWNLTLKTSWQIYVPEDEINQKPVIYTSGIKTTSYRHPSQIQTHQNYSRVHHQNYNENFRSFSSGEDETSQRPYPIYNAHAYASPAPKSQRLTQVYILNGTRIRQNPTRQIVIYNKQQRTPKVEIYKSCPGGATGQFVYESSCNQFLNCWKGRGHVQNCAPGTLFNPKTLECDFPYKVSCISGPRQNVLQHERHAKVVKQIGCPKEFTGLIPNYTDCSKFINCVSGIENFMDCPPGTLFDINKNICDFSHKAACFNGQNKNLKKQNIDGKLDFEAERSSKKIQQTNNLRYRDNEIKCPHGAEGLHRHPTDCSKFLNCANGQTFIQDCSTGTLFNHLLKICDFPYNVRCQNTSGISIVDFDAGYYERNRSLLQPHGVGNQDNFNRYNAGSSTYGTSGGQNLWGTRDQEQYNQGGSRQPDTYSGSRNPYGATNTGQTWNTQYHRQPINQENTYSSSNPYGNKQYNTGSGYDSSVNQYENTHQHTPPIRQGNSYQNNYGQAPYNTGTRQPVSGYYDSSSNQYGNNQPETSITKGTRNQYDDNSYNRGSMLPTNSGSSNSYRPYQYETNSNGQEFATGGSTNQYDNVERGWGQYHQHNKGSIDQPIYVNRQNHGRNQYSKSYEGTQPNRNVYDTGEGILRPTYYTKGSSSTSNQNNWGSSPQYEENRNTWNTRPVSSGSYGGSQNNWGSDVTRYNSGNQYGNNSNTWTNGQGTYGYGTDQYHQDNGSYNRGHGFNNQFEGSSGDGLYSFSSTPTPRNDWKQGQSGHNRWYDQQNRDTARNDWPRQNQDEEGVTSNYDQIVNINQFRKTTRVPFRNSYEPFYGPTTLKYRFNPSQTNDYDDTVGVHQTYKHTIATPKILEKSWPPPFPSTDVNADYVFEYDDSNEVTLEAENSQKVSQKDGKCGKSDFRCSVQKCIPKTLICNGVRDCSDGKDELHCLDHVSKFSVKKNKKLAILEKERWDNVSIATCALLCVEAQKLQCRSFNYRKIDKTCFLTNTNEGLTGALISYYPFDYYELIREKINCSDMYICNNKKCIAREKICDGHDDCGDRMDEKGCKPEDFGYSIRLTGSKNRNEGQIEVTAFGKTGYICDDQFGLRDANVVCKELGFNLGAVEVKGNSFYNKNFTNEKPFYMMDDVSCGGNETSLMDCDFSGWGVHNCLVQEIAGVVCKTPKEKCPDDYWQCDTGQECLPLAFVCDGLLDCSDGSDEGAQHCDAPTHIRLVNGSSRQEGRVEIRHHDIWGTICDDDFNEDAAKVICKYLGYKGSAVVKKNGFFGSGSGPIWLDQVFCSGNETNIESCTHWNWGEHNCEHNEDVGVICSNIYEHERHSLVPIPTVPMVYPDRCGFRKDNIFGRNDGVHFRVVRGSTARKGDYPWQAAIRVKGKTKAAHWCGAVIISEKFVLTAAHCLIGYSKGAYVVVAGDYNVDEDEGTEQQAYIEDFYPHEKFREGHKMNNDIALVKLKGRGFQLNEDVQAICLPDSDTSYETDLNCTISGFGSIESGKSAFSHNLRAGWVPIQKRHICTMPHVYGDALTEGMICAGSLDEGIDSCDGDSGGPLACLNNGVFTLFGITSWGQHCGYANKPGVYVKVAHYRKWIDDNFYKHSKN